MPMVYAFLSVTLVSLISLIGVFTLSMSSKILNKLIFFLVALAVGALIGDAFLHLIPEAFTSDIISVPQASLLIIVGIVLFFILEKVLHWHHHHVCGDSEAENCKIEPLGRLILVSDGLHNVIDGILIGVSYMISVEVGIASTIAIILHEIPQEIGDFGVLIHAGYSKGRALLMNFFTALLSVFGVFAVALLGDWSLLVADWILPIGAGSFIYIASTDLVPELQKRVGLKNIIVELIMIGIGVLAMYLLLFLE